MTSQIKKSLYNYTEKNVVDKLQFTRNSKSRKNKDKKQYTVHQQDTFKNHSSLPKHKQKTEIN